MIGRSRHEEARGRVSVGVVAASSSSSSGRRGEGGSRKTDKSLCDCATYKKGGQEDATCRARRHVLYRGIGWGACFVKRATEGVRPCSTRQHQRRL